jgi:hypothetical protein
MGKKSKIIDLSHGAESRFAAAVVPKSRRACHESRPAWLSENSSQPMNPR